MKNNVYTQLVLYHQMESSQQNDPANKPVFRYHVTVGLMQYRLNSHVR
jgi:hypothetical protein